MKTLLITVAAVLALTASGPTWSDARVVDEQKTAPAASLKPADLDQLLAPIALYPDALLSQMLLCAENPGKVGALSEWLKSQGALKGSELQDAAQKAGFEPSFVALTVFPDVVHWMAGRPEWTAKLGSAFTTDRSGVFASIQRLRVKARDAGTLKSTPQQDVETRTTSSGQQVIVIEPSNPQVVYVPQYNPDVVYTQPATSSTVVVQKESSSTDAAVAAGLIGFTAGIAIGAAFDNDYYYGPYGWGGGFHMYDNAWDDWYDAREDAREDWQDHREDLADERGDVARSQQEQRTERQENRVENRPESQAARDQRRSQAQSTARTQSSGTTSDQSRGYSREGAAASTARSGSGSDAFSNYSSGRSERAASQRGKSSRSSSRGSGGGGGRRR
jgi:Protein of unknown function (DUF3300)